MNDERRARLFALAMVVVWVVFMGMVVVQAKRAPTEVAGTSPPEVASAVDFVHVAEPTGREVVFTLRTVSGGTPAMAFVGVGGIIDSIANPDLHVQVGDSVTINVVNGDPVVHDLTIDTYGVTTGGLVQQEETKRVQFTATTPGTFEYYCSVPGHKQAGMVGKIVVEGDAPADGEAQTVTTDATATPAPANPNAVSIVRNPEDMPMPVGDRAPMRVSVNMTTVEVTGQLADGTTYDYFTFDGKLPGPMLRVRVGDTVELHLKNDGSSKYPHSIDLHAVTGPGGGAVYTQIKPNEEASFTFQALNPGLYVYHCATASIPHHIASGMYGLILVEPEGGLPPVDHEFYVMQGEIYTEQPFGTQGHLTFSADHMSREEADYVVFNGAAGALTRDADQLHVAVGDTVRIYFGVGGPNYVSSFHMIGEIFDRVYDQASLTSPPLTNVQTTLVPPGGATMVEFTVEVPGRYIMVDHALSRLERGLAGYMVVDGDPVPEIFDGEQVMADSGH